MPLSFTSARAMDVRDSIGNHTYREFKANLRVMRLWGVNTKPGHDAEPSCSSLQLS